MVVALRSPRRMNLENTMATEKKTDTWIRWSYRCNGWMWSVLSGAKLIKEGCARSYDEAVRAAQ